MPGITGVVSKAQDKDLPIQLSRMIDALAWQNEIKIEKKCTGQAGLASISRPGESRFADAGDLTLAVAGDITSLEIEDFRRRLIRSGDRDAGEDGLARLFLSVFLQFGVKALSGLNGIYTIAIWDKRDQRLTVINDRYGLRKLYYWDTTDGLFFSSEYKAISRLPQFPRKVDVAGLSDLLTTGYMLDDRTLFEEIQILPGASILTYEHGRCTIERYWDYQFGPAGGKTIPETEIVEGMAARLREAVRRRITDQACILITAGLDSRLIADLFQRNSDHKDITAHSLGDETAHDVRVGREFSYQIGIPHGIIPIPTNYLNLYSLPCVWLTEGNMSVLASWIFAERAAILENNFACIMTGIGGEVISGRHWIFGTGETDLAKALQVFYRRNHFDMLKDLLKPSLSRNLADARMEAVRQTVTSAPTDDPLNKLDYLAFQQDFRRHATSIDVFGDLIQVSDPLIDNDLVDYALTIPSRLRWRGYIYRKTIQKHFPEVAETFDASPANMRSPFQIFVDPRYRKFVERITSKMRREFRRLQNQTGDRPASNIHPNEWIRTVSNEFVTGFLKRSDYLEDYFNMDTVSNLLQAHLDRKQNAYRIITAILTFAQWREAFCDPEFVYSDHVNDQLKNEYQHSNQDIRDAASVQKENILPNQRGIASPSKSGGD